MRARRGSALVGRSRAGTLVLSRRPDESIMVGDQIEISILSIKGGKVTIGVTAPESVSVFRKEVYLRIAEEGRRAEVADHALGRVAGPW
jgi:carbon storage regulator